MIEGKVLRILSSFLLLGSVLSLGLACSSGSDITNASTQQAAYTSTGEPIPYDIRRSFKRITAGNLTFINVIHNYSPTDEIDALALENIETRNPEADVRISEFGLMETEVTIGMYVKFLNSVQQLKDALDSTATTTTSTFTFSSPELLYRNAMYDDTTCGIILLRNSEPQDIVVTPEDLAGTFTLSKAQTIDPFTQPQFKSRQKGRSNGDSSELITFQAAPTRSDYPMVYVTQDDAKEFCTWLGVNYRLPTQNEWSYAAKAGREKVDFGTSTGDVYELDINGALTGRYLANVQGTNATSSSSHDVSTTPFPPNAFGLYDMCGNVFEWTYYKGEDQSSGDARRKGLMGGSFRSTLLSTATIWAPWFMSSGGYTSDVGFRVLYDGSRALTTAQGIEQFYIDEFNNQFN
jgi:formylglycine-generating enzyme required for sulfatase activity